MIKIKYMTVEADGTGSMDFIFDNPEDLARLWSLNGSSDVQITGDIAMQIVDEKLNAPIPGYHEQQLKRWQANGEVLIPDTDDPAWLPPSDDPPQTQPPIPPNVYYSLGNFYDTRTRQGLGMEFAKTWIDRHAEFPEWRDVTL